MGTHKGIRVARRNGLAQDDLRQRAELSYVCGRSCRDCRGASLPEGTVVTVLARDSEEPFDLPPELEAELAAAIADG